MAFVSQAVSSYDAVARSRKTDMSSSEVPFRHFNNYVKKELIQSALDMLHESMPDVTEVTVVDIGSGRGGDLGKWLFMQSPALSWQTKQLSREQITKASRYLCYDVSPECIAEAERRLGMFEGHNCAAMFTVADCYNDSFAKTLAQDQLVEKAHVVSIQFAFHYACASLDSISTLLRNVAMCLCRGGVFIATTVDRVALSAAVRQERHRNALFAVELLDSQPAWVDSAGASQTDVGGAADCLLPIGTAYHFRLEGFVDCPEYVVPLEDVKRIAASHGLRWVPEHSLTFRDMLPSYASNAKKNKNNKLSEEEIELVSLYRCICFTKE